MSTMTDPPKDGFRLSQLIYDTRYRSITIQVVAGLLIVLGFGWLINNTVQNLAALGKDFNFGFLGNQSGYDINQRLAAYDSQDTHSRAAFVGILNTLLVAFLGCILATFLGVIGGVLRLSSNWLVSRLMAVYVEGFRNVPLLLWILVIFALMSEGMSKVSEFRPDGGAAMTLFGNVAVTNQGIFIPRMGWSSLAWVFVAVFAVCLVANYLFRSWARKRQEQTGQIIPTLPISLAIIIVPLILSYFALSGISRSNEQVMLAVGTTGDQTLAEYSEEKGRINFCFVPDTARSATLYNHLREQSVDIRISEFLNTERALRDVEDERCDLIALPQADAAGIMAGLEEAEPDVDFGLLTDTLPEGNAIVGVAPQVSESGIPKFEGGTSLRNSLIALWIALSLYTGAFIAEIVRAGILAVSKGQSEASFALGLRPNRTMNLVVLPQAMRVIIPPLISQYLNLTKNSSLAIAVGYMDVRATLGGITINQTGRELEGMLLLGLFYLLLSLAIAGVMNIYNNSVKLKER